MFILDTNILSEARKAASGRAPESLQRWMSEVPRFQTHISAITLFEIQRGALLAARSDPAKGARLATWIEEGVVPQFSGRILAVDSAVATAAARLHVPDPAPFTDALIAATAIVHQMSIVTRNVRDFERFEGVQVISP